MSLARVKRVNGTRKEWKCEKCGDTVPIGGSVLAFSVGFRAPTRRRCTKPECYPKNSELESSQVSEVYAALEGVDFGAASDQDEIEAMLQEVADAATNVASEYEGSEMYEINYNLQERAEALNTVAQDIEDWSPGRDQPQEDDESTWGEKGSYQEALDEWLDDIKQEAQDLLDTLDLP